MPRRRVAFSCAILLFMCASSSELREEDECSEATFDSAIAAGVKHTRTNKHYKALMCLKRAANLHPENPRTLTYLGESLLRVGEVERGIFELQRATSLLPSSAVGFLLLATAFQKLGDQHQARYVHCFALVCLCACLNARAFLHASCA